MREPTTEKQRYWAGLLKAAEDSGMSLAEFAKTKDIPAQKLYQWRSTLRDQPALRKPGAPTKFAQVVVPPFSGAMTIEFGGARLRFERLPDVQWLSHLLRSQDIDR